MENREQFLSVLDRDSDSEFYFNNLTEEQLLEIIRSMNDFDDVGSALTELSARGLQKDLVEQSSKILEKNLGDEFLQATAFNLLYTKNAEQAVKIVKLRNSDLSPSLLGEIMNSLASNSAQPFENSLSREFLHSIADIYSDLDNEDKNRISDDYEYFKEKYKSKLL